MAYKYPYIPKEYYAAVMFACKMIRDDGYFHKAINSAAKYYNVDKDELEKHVRERQGAGQKGKTRGAYKKYKVTYCYWSEANGYSKEDVFYCKALSANNAITQCFERNPNIGDPSSSYYSMLEVVDVVEEEQ